MPAIVALDGPAVLSLLRLRAPAIAGAGSGPVSRVGSDVAQDFGAHLAHMLHTGGVGSVYVAVQHGAAHGRIILQAQLLQAAAEKLGVTRPLVLGHSYGGAVAMAWGLTDTPDTAALDQCVRDTRPLKTGLIHFFMIMQL